MHTQVLERLDHVRGRPLDRLVRILQSGRGGRAQLPVHVDSAEAVNEHRACGVDHTAVTTVQ